MYLRWMLGLAVLLAPDDGPDAGGGGGGGNTPPGQTTPAPAAPPVDPEKLRAETRAAARVEFLKEQGFADEAAYKAHLDEKKNAENAKLSETERTKKLYQEALDARGKAESDVERWKNEAKDAKEALALRDRLDAQGVLPGERKFVEVELRDAEATAKKASQTFDSEKFWKDLRDKRPYFFSKDAATPANTSPRAPAPGTNPTNPTLNGQPLSPDEMRKKLREQGYL